jgi:hypothetical protein
VADEAIILRDQFEVKPGERLAFFDSPAALAYAAVDRHNAGRAMFALIGAGDLPCRGLELAASKPTKQVPVLWPEAIGIVDWPISPNPGGEAVWGRRPALIFDVPKGEKFQPDFSTPQRPLSEQQLTRMLIAPAVASFRELHASGITYRAFRPGNLYRATESSTASITLGECLSAPPGFGQPPLFEPIEHLGADPLGRGPGQTADDYYALGVLAALLHFGNDPTFGWDAERIAFAKINQSSFVLLAGREKMAPSMAELLRGLMVDNPDARWGAKQVEAWIKGQQATPAQTSTQQRAARPAMFAGQEHMTKMSLAHAVGVHWQDGLKLVDSADLENWLRRGFSEEKAGEELNRIMVRAGSPGPSGAQKDRALSRICIMLDPGGPLRYRGVRADLTGLGVLLSRASVQDEAAIELADMLRGRLHFAWLEGRPSLRSDHIQVRRILEGLDKYVDRLGPGFGIERVLYELEPGAPCRSPLIADYYVISIRDLLPAIDAVIPSLPVGTVPIDRHIAAFIGAHLMRNTDRELSMLYTEKEEAGMAVAALRLFAVVQYANPNRNLPRLSAAMVAALRPALELFHNRAARATIERQLNKYAAECDFSAMAALMEPDGSARKKDAQDYLIARRTYMAAKKYAKWLEAGGLTNPDRVRAMAARMAAGTSAFAASAAITAYCVWAMW